MKIIFLLLLVIAGSIVTSAQSVGIGTTTPHNSAQLEIKSTTGGLLLPRLSNTNRNAIANPPGGLTIFNTSFNRFEYYDGSAWKQFLDNNYWSRNGDYVYTLNNVGLGTAAPSASLDVFGNIKITEGNLRYTRFTGTNSTIDFKFSGASSNGLMQGFDFDIDGITRSYVNFNHSDIAGEDAFRLGFNNGTSATLKSSGNLILNAASGTTIQLRSLGIDKGFVQLSSNDDLRVGTNAANTAGQFYFRLDGSNRVLLSSNGFLKIGSGTPTERLDVEGNILSNGSFTSTGNLVSDNISFGDKITGNNTGSFTVVPLAYGYVDYDGSIINATSNVAARKVSQGLYEITVTGINAESTVIVSGGETITAAYYTTDKWRITNYMDLTETLNNITRSDAQFYFIIFQP